MNKAKLSALCTKARGCTIEDGFLRTPEGKWIWDYNPIDDANQADDLLEYVADKIGGIWSIGKNRKKTYWCAIMGPLLEFTYFVDHQETKDSAKILCSLRASPEVTDAEIEEALK